MKNMKKQGKKFSSWGLKGLLSVALSGLAVVAFAQGAEVCHGTSYTIADAVPASAGSEYRWLENGNVLAGTNQATYTVPGTKVAGVYTYIRQSKSTECPDWQSSNKFTVTVFDCSFSAGTETGATATFTDPRDGKQYKAVRMPDGRIWFAQNLNYTKDLTFNMYAREANGMQLISAVNGTPAIGSYWCPGVSGSTYSGDQNMCNIYGALYSWETAMMVDGKFADESKTSSAWDELWISPYYYSAGKAYSSSNEANINNARAGRGICPSGWHIPTFYEWSSLLESIAGTTMTYNGVDTWTAPNASAPLRTTATYPSTHADPGDGSWRTTSIIATDQYGFSAVPSGVVTVMDSGTYRYRGETGFFNSSTAYSAHSNYYTAIQSKANEVNLMVRNRVYGQPVRCMLN
jgi:uncharacterized protein (TIGR02145 family)